MTETWFDQRPTHAIRPAALDAAHAAARSMWAERDAVLDGMLDAQALDTPLLDQMADAARMLDDLSMAEFHRWEAQKAMTLEMMDYRHEPSQYAEHAGAFLP